LDGHEDYVLSEATNLVEEFNEWMRERGGVDVGFSFIKLIVTGQRHSGVVITGMRAKTNCGHPLHGALFYGPSEGERENIQIGFNLDEVNPIAREGNPNKQIGEPGYLGRSYFKSHTVSLALGEDQAFSIVAATEHKYCSWYIDITVFVDGRSEHVIVAIGQMKMKTGMRSHLRLLRYWILRIRQASRATTGLRRSVRLSDW